jgi:pilus assembly protein Flp/PilA
MAQGRRRGQGLVEYALILVLVVIVVVVALTVFGEQTANVTNEVANAVANVT